MGRRDNPVELASVRAELRRVTAFSPQRGRREGSALFAVNYDKLRNQWRDNKYEIDIAGIRNLRGRVRQRYRIITYYLEISKGL